MEKVYIFGHRNPDTDSVTAAITLSYLKNKNSFSFHFLYLLYLLYYYYIITKKYNFNIANNKINKNI